jgi:uncharacterized protein (DUF427 family)
MSTKRKVPARGTQPPVAVVPGPGQESVWDYPRPPRVEPCSRLIRVDFGGRILAESRSTFRVLETSHPPVYYLPVADIDMARLARSDMHSWCEWKGLASYYHLLVSGAGAGAHDEERRIENVAWHFPDPTLPYKEIRDHVAFYPQVMDGCFVDGERVEPQPGGFYGGWITHDVVGPFKGGPETSHW